MTNHHVLNIRLPKRTHEQLEALKAQSGMTKTQLVIMALDRIASEILAKDETR